ncbi:cryptococcal mannosyltransferase 1-domain-containing protein [Aspergillus pseudonomiae]|uniref:Cryptococcal mannosyltransferase 1-domain-containing protein n=1 Tax=Aspergillus pseudonomiae TaxID=1506151 RepID=A0A5N6IF65_9EURO|nr:cryptococcal mannosyltransferase 1-domain-containing protein [Aspergillus pseudonomiae]KAB8265402.1 cryptococcal mannosyltransferase 1-domain-containing protein [Aspergillus pseudonomiae]KAE8402394.1 cryptococcal mannosyltransferase 1-domain-containing protein [Aspergillus pseudonomiae]
MKAYLYCLYRRTRRLRLALSLVIVAWTLVEVLHIKYTLVQQSQPEPVTLGNEKIYITGLHWNSEQILREAWIAAVVDLANAIGRDNVFVSVQESGSWDDTKGALLLLDQQLAEHGIPRRVLMDYTTHFDEISKPPTGEGWIETPIGTTELRRIPYLAKLRNVAMEPFYELQSEGIIYDKILFLNDVVFTTHDIHKLLSTRGGNYAATCSLDFSKPPNFYDTFALRDAEGHDMLMQSWPYFRSRASRRAMKDSQPVPVTSCWNGVVAMDAAPFYQHRPLKFRGIPDSLATSHLEGSECCLIHADNPSSREKGVWLNPNVRVGYSSPAYLAVNPMENSWLSSFSIASGVWKNRVLRWITTPWFKENIVWMRLWKWEKLSDENIEPGTFCLVNEMQVLTENGWAHR